MQKFLVRRLKSQDVVFSEGHIWGSTRTTNFVLPTRTHSPQPLCSGSASLLAGGGFDTGTEEESSIGRCQEEPDTAVKTSQASGA